MISLCVSCNVNTFKNKHESIDIIDQTRLLLNKKCTSIDSVILKDSIKDNIVVFLYHGSDCYSCIKTGFEITHEIDSIIGYQKVFIVGIMANIGQEQTMFKYYNYIHQDPKDLIRKELKYLPTPIMFLVNTDRYIVDVLQPGNCTREQIDKFIENVTCLQDSVSL